MNIQHDIKLLLVEAGISQKDFAAMAGVNACALSKFMNRRGTSLAERLIPYVYGDKRPPKKSAHAPEA